MVHLFFYQSDLAVQSYGVPNVIGTRVYFDRTGEGHTWCVL